MEAGGIARGLPCLRPPAASPAPAGALVQGRLIASLPLLLLGVIPAGLARWLSPGGRWLQRRPSHPLLG
ncbi:MAG: hypothetical protein ACK559_06455, partial [bacterium]